MKVAIITTVLVILVATAFAAEPKKAAEPKGFAPKRPGYRASLNAANQKPSTGVIPNSDGVAEFSLEVDEMAQTAKYSFWMANIVGYIMSHIHVGGPAQSGPVAVLLLPGHVAGTPTNLTGATLPTTPPFDICTLVYTSTFSAADLIAFGGAPALTWAQFLSNLNTGNLYVNVHTQAYPAGVIRGQLMASPFTNTKCPYTKTWWTAKDFSAGAEPKADGAKTSKAGMDMGRKF